MVARYGWRRVVSGIVIAAGALGCGRDAQPGAQPALSIPNPANSLAPVPAPPAASSFAESVLTETDDADQLPPPDRTLNGHSTGKLRATVQKLWDEITFVTPAGKAVAFNAILDTEHGPVTLALLSDVAPRHVCNFIALARAGYYDGLVFEHVLQTDRESDVKMDLIEGGCPLGTGEPGIGHLGYWLKSEYSTTVKHTAGVVGACRGDAPDTAGCRFYINLSDAPIMDGNFTIFGRVTAGLDVVGTIAQQPRAGGSIRPNQPAVIRKVTIQTREVDK